MDYHQLGPFPSQEYSRSLAQYFTANPPQNLRQLQVQRHQQSLHTNQPHFYARTSAQMNKLRTTKDDSPLVQHQEWSAALLKDQQSQQWNMLDLGGMNILKLNQQLFSYNFLTCLYLQYNQLTLLPAEISRLKSLLVLDVSFNKLKLLPNEIGELRNLKELLVFDNQLETVPWQLCYCKLEVLGIEGNPIADNPFVQLITREGLAVGLQWLRDYMPYEVQVPHHPPPRRFIPHETQGVKVMSWNILAEKYATQQQFWYASQWALNWQVRRDRIMKDIRELDCDLVCLQEMEYAQYCEYFSQLTNTSVLATDLNTNVAQTHQESKYASMFLPKSRFKTMAQETRKSVDGCAIYWNRYKFRQKYQPLIVEFTQIALGRSDFSKNDTLFQRFCSKDNVALGVVLENLEEGYEFLLVNVHIHWDPEQTDVKLVQTILLMEEIDAYFTRIGRRLPLLMCGDFNSLPSGLVYEYLSSPDGIQEMDRHPDLQACFLEQSNSQSAKSGSSDSLPDQVKRWESWHKSGYGKISETKKLRHFYSGKLLSAYSDIEGQAVENQNIYIGKQVLPALPFTNHTANFTGVIDYIWHSTDFEVGSVLGGFFLDKISRDLVGRIRNESEGMVHGDDVWSIRSERVIGFPNPVFPSDHLPVVCVLNRRRQK